MKIKNLKSKFFIIRILFVFLIVIFYTLCITTLNQNAYIHEFSFMYLANFIFYLILTTLMLPFLFVVKLLTTKKRYYYPVFCLFFGISVNFIVQFLYYFNAYQNNNINLGKVFIYTFTSIDNLDFFVTSVFSGGLTGFALWVFLSMKDHKDTKNESST